jgi:protein arginine N-methyltransferase 1
VANEALLRTFDITTMSKEDAAFTAPFKLRATKNDFVHALVGAWGARGLRQRPRRAAGGQG